MQTLLVLRRNTRGILDETDVDSFFHDNYFDCFQSQHRIARVSRGSDKKIFSNQIVPVLRFKDTQALYPPRKVNLSARELTSLIICLRDFLKSFDDASKCIPIPLQKPKVEIRSTKSKDNIFGLYFNDTIEHANRQNVLPFRFGNNRTCDFSIKKFKLHGYLFILTEVINLNQREIHHLYENR